MKQIHFLCWIVVLCLIMGCKKENRIRKELSGVWTIEKSEVTTYTNGVPNGTTTLENVGSFNLQDFGDGAPEYNRCYIDFETTYWPLGFDELNNTYTRQQGYCHWYGDLRARDRITFWESGGFANSDEIFVIYTRTKNANGLGKNEEWLYLRLDANGNFVGKEVLQVHLEDPSGRVE